MSRGVDAEEVIFKSALAFLGMVVVLLIISFGVETAGAIGGVAAALMIAVAVGIGYGHEAGYLQ